MLDRASIAHFGPLNAQGLRLTIDAFAGSALGINGVVERALPIEGDALEAAEFPVDILDTALAFRELVVLARRPGLGGKEQRTAEALSAKCRRGRRQIRSWPWAT